MNLPLILTWSRIILVPIFVAVFYIPAQWAHPLSAFIFFLAGVTDWADGYLARKFSMTTRFGAFLDPVADKLMVASALVMLSGIYQRLWIVIPAIIIIGREIAISALREWMAQIGETKKVAVAYIGKIKTAMQMLALLLLIYHNPLDHWSPIMTGAILLSMAATLTIISMMKYLLAIRNTY